MSSFKQSRTKSFLSILLIYLAAGFLGWWVYAGFEPSVSPLWRLFWADIAATIFVWFFGLVFKNVSVYDPYWSVLPPVTLTLWAVFFGYFGLAQWLVLIAIWAWAIRLTGNWVYTFRNLNTEDWRYTKYRTEHSPLVFHLINLFGLNLMPTLMVFLCMLPGLYILDHPCEVNAFTWVGFFVCLAAVIIQLVSDTQRHRFSKAHQGEVCNIGLWTHGRHPNYFGEITMWWGIWIMFVSMFGFGTETWYVVGPLLMTCLFLFISIPLMENRQLQNKPAYAEYRKHTRRLI